MTTSFCFLSLGAFAYTKSWVKFSPDDDLGALSAFVKETADQFTKLSAAKTQKNLETRSQLDEGKW